MLSLPNGGRSRQVLGSAKMQSMFIHLHLSPMKKKYIEPKRIWMISSQTADMLLGMYIQCIYIYMACTQVHHQFKTLCWPTINQRTDVHSPKKLETPPLKNMIDPSGSGSAPRNKYIVHIKKKKTSRRAVSFARYIKSTFRACEAHRVWWTQTCFVWMLTNQTI